MKPLSFLLLALLAGGISCSGKKNPPAARIQVPHFRDVVATHILEGTGRGIGELPVTRRSTFRQLLDASAVGGEIGKRASRDLREAPPLDLSSVFLGLVEDRSTEVRLRRLAYGWLREAGPPAIVPRLILRLKYEKDWPSNVTVALALLQRGNGAGLEALQNILASDKDDPLVQQARSAAAQALLSLPPREGWTPGAEFQADWKRLLEVEVLWLRERRLAADGPEPVLDRDTEAEVWRFLAHFDSQPLRPVDDARYVLSRMGGRVVPELIAALSDKSAYVREHSLQTLTWMGYAVGAWARRTGFDILGPLTLASNVARTRARALEAMGAAGLPEAANTILPWLSHGNREETTAAADALLRCGGKECLKPVRKALSKPEDLSDEAHYSLSILLSILNGKAPPAQPRPALSPSEKERRDRWAQERRMRTAGGR
ncbi:MAG: HEAT repeat domain-containing protein [Planctomycetota bacterium]